uniref:(northern house mosquito) hypothetical protein n=1 Tax=Culex pipiens TaxID=7175 RepID=A0A8D8C195_CULPI
MLFTSATNRTSVPRAPRSTAFSVFCTRSNTSTACARVQANLNSAVYRLYPYTNLKFKPNLAPLFIRSSLARRCTRDVHPVFTPRVNLSAPCGENSNMVAWCV